LRAGLELQFWNDAGATRMRVPRQDVPWRAIRAFPNGAGESLVHLHNVSGGVFGGDELQVSVEIGEAARAQITSTSATRTYRSKGAEATQQARIQIRKDGFLEYVPDHTILFAGSKFSQTTAIQLACGSGLIWWDVISAGRVARGETFAFYEYTSDLTIHSTPEGGTPEEGRSRPIMIDRYRLNPAERDPASLARFGPYLYSATLYVCHISKDQSRWIRLEEQLNRSADELSNADARWGASALAEHGLIVRGLAREAYQITGGLERFWRESKAAIWNLPACWPRKIR
jgi:urease accessory protein